MPSNFTIDASGNDFQLQQYLRGVAAALQIRDVRRAQAIGEDATSRGFEHPDLLALAAQSRMDKGDADGALPLLSRARKMGPRNVDVLNALGLCLIHLGRAHDALAVFDAAMRQKPGTAQLLFNKALAYEQLGQLDQERQLLERVVEIDPGNVAALSLLALMAADRNDDGIAREFAGRALARSPGEIPARVALATVDIAARNFSAARSQLESLLRDVRPDAENLSIVQTLMGDMLDGEGKYAEAFRAYAAAKETLRSHYAPVHGRSRVETVRAQALRFEEYFRAAPSVTWQNVASAPEVGKPRTHVFLLGFLRSGTTLLGQILASHPDVELMEERDCLADAGREFIVQPDGLDRLSELSGESLNRYRDAYWRRAQAFGHFAASPVFVDKHPLSTAYLPLVAKLFPDARILFAFRDPRDVVLSCFRRRFAMSEEKFELLTLDGVVDYYSGVMRLGDIYRDRLDLGICDVRHESLVATFEAEMRRVCDFLGIAWSASMHEFSKRARTRNINTPNSAQIVRGLSSDGVDRWRLYRDQLAPVLPRLAHWVSRFGYAED